MSIGLDSFKGKRGLMLGAAVGLSVYLALSVTGLNPVLVLAPLIVSGLLLAMDDSQALLPGARTAPGGVKWAVALLFVSVCLSAAFSYSRSASLEAAVTLFPSLLMAAILIPILERHAHIVVWGVVAMVFVASCVSLAMFARSLEVEPGPVFQLGKTPALVVPNDMVLGVVFSPLLVFSVVSERRILVKAVACAVLVTLLAALYFIQSRLCFLVAWVVLGFYLHRYFPRYFIGLFLAVIAALVVADRLFTLNIVQQFWLIPEESTRVAIWYAALDSVRQHPIVGYGPSQFYIAYEQLISSASLPDWMVLDPRGVPWAHNLYLEALSERGVLGFGVFAYLLVKLHHCLYIAARGAAGPRRNLSFAVYVSFIAFLVAGFFELTLQRIWVANALFIFIGFALCNNSDNSAARTKTGSDPA